MVLKLFLEIRDYQDSHRVLSDCLRQEKSLLFPALKATDPETGLSDCLWRTTSKKSASNDTGKARNGNPTKRLIKEKEKMAKRAWRKVVLPNRDRPFPFGPQYTMALQGKGHIQVAIEHRGHRRRIVRYKEASLYEWGFFRGWKGTLFENKFIWEQLLLLTALASLIGSITYFSGCPRTVELDDTP